jgi:hypothetical protein
MSEFRLALAITQVRFKQQPAALADPYARLAQLFDPKVDVATGGSITELRLVEDRLVITSASDRVIVRVENPDEDEVALAKMLAAWKKIDDQLDLGEILAASFRVLLVADRPGKSIGQLAAPIQRRFADVPVEAANWGLTLNIRHEGGGRRLQFAPAITAHVQESFNLTVPEQTFYQADIDDVIGVNTMFASAVRRAELAVSLRGSREYADAILSALENEREEPLDDDDDRGQNEHSD